MSKLTLHDRIYRLLCKLSIADAVLVALCGMLLFGAYVSLGGYPVDWDEAAPCSALGTMIHNHGMPMDRNEKYCESIWRTPHLLGWYELATDNQRIYITSYIGIGSFSLKKILLVRSCGGYCR